MDICICQQSGFRWRHILRTLQRYTDTPRVLDVGAGNGYFVFLARAEFGLQADGLEISAAEAEFARKIFGVELLRGELAAIDTQYDVVSSFNVIEHVQEPTALLVQMRDRLAARGHLTLTTPNPSCIHRRLLGLQRMEHGLPATSHQPVHAHRPVRRACARWLRDSRIQHAEHVHTSPSQVRHRGPAVSQGGLIIS